MLETVWADPTVALVTSFMENAVTVLRASTHREPPATHRLGKAKVHAFLATFTEPDRDLGKAALAGVWQYEHQALRDLLKVLQKM